MATQSKRTNKNENIINEKEENIAKINKDEKEELLKHLQEENINQKSQIDLLTKNLEILQSQIKILVSTMDDKKSNKEINEDVLIGCRKIYGDVLSTSDNSLVIPFDCDEEKYINSEDLKLLLKQNSQKNNKKLFENDIFYFVDKNNYERFKVIKRFDLSKDNIIRILNLPREQMIDEVNLLTNQLRDFNILHAFQFEIVKMLINSNAPLKNWSYDNRAYLENYLNIKFDDLAASVGAIELLGRKKFNN